MHLHVAIVGAGPGGMSAAIEAHRRGARVTLIDEAERPGGQIFRQGAAGPDLRVGLSSELKRKKELLSRFSQIRDRIEYLSGCTAYALFEGPELHLSDAAGSRVVKPDTVSMPCDRWISLSGIEQAVIHTRA